MKTLSIILIALAGSAGVFNFVNSKNSGSYDKLYAHPEKQAVEHSVNASPVVAKEAKPAVTVKEEPGKTEAVKSAPAVHTQERPVKATEKVSERRKLDPKLYSRAALIEEEYVEAIEDSIILPVTDEEINDEGQVETAFSEVQRSE